MADVAILTCDRFANFHPEDEPLVRALAECGLSAQPAIWDQSPRPPSRAWLVRTPWDYVLKAQQFRAFLQGLPGSPPIFNSAALLQWNMHKGYLLDLQRKGVPVVPTVVYRAGHSGPVELPAAFQNRPEQRWVAKPAVGAGSVGALLGRWPEVAAHLSEFVTSQDMLLQPYLSALETYPERSLIYLDGVFSHAVARPRFLQEAHSPEALLPLVTPSQAELNCAERVLAALPERTLYARVDLILDDAGSSVLLEFEVIEPQLFFLECPQACSILAKSLEKRLMSAL